MGTAFKLTADILYIKKMIVLFAKIN